jgi:hypothetical protein
VNHFFLAQGLALMDGTLEDSVSGVYEYLRFEQGPYLDALIACGVHYGVRELVSRCE